MKEAGDDSNIKAMVVNQIAETISRINKIEDFTKQQDYIKRCSELLRIEETGLNALVNKFIREKVAKQEIKQGSQESSYFDEQVYMGSEESSASLFNKDELHERALIKCLLEFGLKSWEEEKKVADYIFEEFDDHSLFDNKKLVHIIDTYKTWYQEGIEPSARNFLYHENQELSTLVVGIMDFPYELSPNWKDHFEGKIATREDLYKEETLSTITYLKLRKIKRMIEENQKDLEKPHSSEEQMMLLQTHQHLKQMETALTRLAGTVIIRS
jgi:DNA primase